MKKEKLFIRLIYAYIILVLFYGIVIKVTINSTLIFSLKTYLPEVLIVIAALICLTNKKSWLFTKFEVIGALYFLTVIFINFEIHGFSYDVLYLFRDMYIPIFTCLIFMKMELSSEILDKFYRFIWIISMIYLISGALLGIVEVMHGWKWSSEFYTGYSFYNVDPYSKVKISQAFGQLRAPGLTGNSVSFSYYGILAMAAIFNKRNFNLIFKIFFFICEMTILVSTLNKTAIVIFIVIAFSYLFKRVNKFNRNVIYLVLGIIAMVYVTTQINSDIFYSTLARIRYWGTLDSYVNPFEIILPYNSFLYNPGAKGFLSFWDNTYLYFLFSVGIFGTMWIYILCYKLKKRICIANANMRNFFNYLFGFLILSSLFNNITEGRAFFGLYLLLGGIYYSRNACSTLKGVQSIEKRDVINRSNRDGKIDILKMVT